MDCGEDPQARCRPESPRTGIDEEDVGVKGGGGGDGGDGSEAAPAGPPRIWVCGHCTDEHLMQIKGQGRYYSSAAIGMDDFFARFPVNVVFCTSRGGLIHRANQTFFSLQAS